MLRTARQERTAVVKAWKTKTKQKQEFFVESVSDYEMDSSFFNIYKGNS